MTTTLEWTAIIALLCTIPAVVLGLVNMRRYRRAPVDGPDLGARTLAVCVPARNEAGNIEACVRDALAMGTLDGAPAIRVLVYDDQSDDETPRILARLVAEDDRVIVVPTQPLPEGWNGKQHACHRMGEWAAAMGADSRPDWLLFTDADVRFDPACGRRALLAADSQGAGMISTIPHELTGTIGEVLVVPLIHVALLCYLPFGRMRRTLDPAASAAIGQFILVRTDDWSRSGGHAAIRDSMHDGVKLPRVLRRAGVRTDLFDGTDLVSCRMYRGFGETWRGFAKNAYEGLGNPILLLLVTFLHLVGHVAPWLIFAIAFAQRDHVRAAVLAAIAVGLQFGLRAIFAARFRQSPWVVPLHPLSMLLLTAVQWWSLLLHLRGRRAWKGRVAGS